VYKFRRAVNRKRKKGEPAVTGSNDSRGGLGF
jgi:hypothetical protein